MQVWLTYYDHYDTEYGNCEHIGVFSTKKKAMDAVEVHAALTFSGHTLTWNTSQDGYASAEINREQGYHVTLIGLDEYLVQE